MTTRFIPVDESSALMSLIHLPSESAQTAVRKKAEAHLRARYSPGTYGTGAAANEIIKHQYNFFDQELASIARKLPDLDTVAFLLDQYDLSCTIDRRFKSAMLNEADAAEWNDIRQLLRRGIKHLVERVCMNHPTPLAMSDPGERCDLFDRAWVCAKELIKCGAMSDQTIFLLPNHTSLQVHEAGFVDYMSLVVDRAVGVDLDAAMRLMAANERICAQPIWNNDEAVDNHLGAAMRETIGVTYADAISMMVLVCRSSVDDMGSPISVPFVGKGELVSAIAAASGHSIEAASKVLSGLTISKRAMVDEGRDARKPKQEYRAFRRAIFEFDTPGGTICVWSRQMLIENLLQLKKHIVFRWAPAEWRSEQVERALVAVSDMASKWFEHTCATILRQLGFSGARSFRRRIGDRVNGIEIPANVGEIDCIGYSHETRTLLLAECKMTRPAYEPAQFRDDYGSYVAGNKSYVDKLHKKISWVRENASAVVSALRSLPEFGAHTRPLRLVTVLITYRPNIAREFIDDTPVVSLVELKMDYERTCCWPYSAGVFPLMPSDSSIG